MGSAEGLECPRLSCLRLTLSTGYWRAGIFSSRWSKPRQARLLATATALDKSMGWVGKKSSRAVLGMC